MPKTRIIAAGIVLVCTLGLGTAQAAHIAATDVGGIATLAGSQFDVALFTSIANGASVDGNGQFIATTTATGQAVVGLTEGLGGPVSSWLHLVYSAGAGNNESLQVFWRTSGPSGLAPLPGVIVPQFLVRTGGSQDVTSLLIGSAVASGFTFPSNITFSVQSDGPTPLAAAVPEPATLTLTALGLAGVIARHRRNRRRSIS